MSEHRAHQDKCHLFRLNLHHEFHELGRRITLDVKLCLDQRPQTIYIVSTDVTLVGTRMHRNAVRTYASQSAATFRRSGTFSSRAHCAKVAILLMLTLRFVIFPCSVIFCRSEAFIKYY